MRSYYGSKPDPADWLPETVEQLLDEEHESQPPPASHNGPALNGHAGNGPAKVCCCPASP